MSKELKIATTIFIVVFIIDQVVKFGFANLNWDVDGPYMSLKLAYNYGVAFSMFSFCGSCSFSKGYISKMVNSRNRINEKIIFLHVSNTEEICDLVHSFLD